MGIEIGQTISHYKILRKLGHGGMGDVYLAENTRLGLKVALKFLASEFTRDPNAIKRMEHEARAVAELTHPNISRINDIEEANGHHFLVLEYLEGETLSNRIQRSPLSIEETIRIGKALAEGLAHAHAHGIVHRDIKAPNVMLTSDGGVKIMDFGLARMPDATRLTEPGTTLGTVSHMSPEQASGKEADERSDLWSLGVVLYQCLTGRLPFEGESAPIVLNRIGMASPAPPTSLRTGVPMELDRVVLRCLEKDRKLRYQTASDVLANLRLLETGGTAPTSTAPTVALSAQEAITQAPSIAVLPFIDMSPEQDQQYFCDGMAEEIINDLVKIEGLRVAARTSAFAFKGKQEDVREIGKILGVGSLLEGSVRKAGNQLRITAQLTSTSEGYHLWSERYDRELKDVFAIQEEIAQSIVHKLKIRLSDSEERVLKRTPTKDLDAYELYLRGREFFWHGRRASFEHACNMFAQAIERDSRFALAYAGMADCYSWLFMFHDHDRVNLEKALMASRNALSADTELAEAHASYGLALSLDKQFREAEREFEVAMQLNPNLFEAYLFLGRINRAQGAPEKAARLFKQACLIDPLDYQAAGFLALAYVRLGLDEDAQEAYVRAKVNVERRLKLNPDDAKATYYYANFWIRLGDPHRALVWAAKALAMDPEDSHVLYNVACIYSLAGMPNEAVEFLGKAVEAGFPFKEWAEQDPDFDSIRGDMRFRRFLQRLDS